MLCNWTILSCSLHAVVLQMRRDLFRSACIAQAALDKDVLDMSEGKRFVHPASAVQRVLTAVEARCKDKAARIQPRDAALALRLRNWHAMRIWSDAPVPLKAPPQQHQVRHGPIFPIIRPHQTLHPLKTFQLSNQAHPCIYFTMWIHNASGKWTHAAASLRCCLHLLSMTWRDFAQDKGRAQPPCLDKLGAVSFPATAGSLFCHTEDLLTLP